MVSVNNLYVFGSDLSDGNGNVWRNYLKSCVNGVGDDCSKNSKLKLLVVGPRN